MIPVSALNELSRLMTGMEPPAFPKIIAVPEVHAVARKTERTTASAVTPAVAFGFTRTNRIGTAVLLMMNWVQRSRESPMEPAAIAVLSELSIRMLPSMLQSVRAAVQVWDCATLGPNTITLGELVAPTGGRFQRSVRFASTAPDFTRSAGSSTLVERSRQSVTRIWLVPVPTVNVLSASIAGTEP